MVDISENDNENLSFMKNLLNRRVPQILGIYLAIGWGLVQFVDWLAGRYLLSPYLTDLTFVIFAAMIPTSIVIAYYHGKPGRNRWVWLEKIMLPANIVIAAFLVFVIFEGKDLGALSRKVTVEDESGKKIERTIPKSQYRKKIALYYFDNKSGDSSIDWLQYGIVNMLAFDFSQDHFVQITTPTDQTSTLNFSNYEKIKNAGYPEAVKLPLSLKMKLTRESHMDYFLCGTLLKEGDSFIIDSFLYKSKNAKLISNRSFRGKDIFQLIDDMSLQSKRDLDIPKAHLEEVVDLPLREAFTNSLPAARLHTLGQNAMVFDRDWGKSQEYFQESVKIDPTFAISYLGLLTVGQLSNRDVKSAELIETIMKHSHKLPERTQVVVKYLYYEAKGQLEKSQAVLKMAIKIFPDDLKLYYMYSTVLTFNNQLDEAIAVNKKILEIDPGGFEIYKTLGDLYEQKGDPDQALKYYEKFVEHFPDNAQSYTLIGGFNKRIGNYNKAKEYFEKAQVLKPGDISIALRLAEIEKLQGNFDTALQQYNDTLKQCKTDQQKADVYEKLTDFYDTRGQFKKAREYHELYMKSFKKFAPPLLALLVKVMSLAEYIAAGQEEEAFKQLNLLKPKFPPTLEQFVSFGFVRLYLKLNNADEAAKRLPAVEKFIKEHKVEQLMGIIYSSKGKINELRGEYGQAIENYQTQLKISPAKISINRDLGRCYRHLKQYKEAEEKIKKTLNVDPLDPKANYELALVHLEQGEKEKAVKYLKVALDVWKNADPDFEPARQARQKMAEIQPGKNQ